MGVDGYTHTLFHPPGQEGLALQPLLLEGHYHLEFLLDVKKKISPWFEMVSIKFNT